MNIKDFTAEVLIDQRFENTEKDPIEAVYEFPVDPKVCFSVEMLSLGKNEDVNMFDSV